MPTLNWIGKDAVIRHHKEVPFRLLEADAGLSHGGATGNLIVQGDNLHALKALLPKYAGKVKCIYIDPKVVADRKIGGLWEELSGGKCLFVMVKDKDWTPITEKIGG